MRHTLFHYNAPFTTVTKDDTFFRESMYLDPEETAQRDILDARIRKLGIDANLIQETKGTLVRREYSLSEPESVFMNQNYRYVLLEEEMRNFQKTCEKFIDLFMDFHVRVGIGFSPTLLDKLITRTYVALSCVPTETNPHGNVAHDIYPAFWVYPYIRSRLHEFLSVGIN